jgi:hypothetical protein
MGGKSQDFGDVAASQGDENRAVVNEQVWANRPTQYTPWGATNWTTESVTDPSTGEAVNKWSQTQSLTPELQELLNKQNAIAGGKADIAGMLTGRMGSEFGNEMDWSGLNPMGAAPTAQFTLPEGGDFDPNSTRAGAEDAMYSQAKSRLDPQFASKRQGLEMKMRNQGLGPEDAAWKSQMDTLGQQENDATNQAMWSASGEGRKESSQMYNQTMGQDMQNFNMALGANQQNFGQAMGQSGYANQIRQQQLTEQMQKRGFSLNEINALMGGGQVQAPNMPNFAQQQTAQPAPIYQAATDSSNMEQMSQQGLISGAATIAGGMMGGPAGAVAANAATSGG